MTDENRITIRMPEDYLAEMEQVRARVGTPISRMVVWGWEAIREKMLKLPAIQIIREDTTDEQPKRK